VLRLPSSAVSPYFISVRLLSASLRLEPVDCPPSGVGDPDANDLGWLAANLDGLALRCSQSGTYEAREHFASESVGEQQRFSKTARVDGEQL